MTRYWDRPRARVQPRRYQGNQSHLLLINDHTKLVGLPVHLLPLSDHIGYQQQLVEGNFVAITISFIYV